MEVININKIIHNYKQSKVSKITRKGRYTILRFDLDNYKLYLFPASGFLMVELTEIIPPKNWSA